MRQSAPRICALLRQLTQRPFAPRPRLSDFSDLRDSPEISSASHTVASKIRMLAARCARSLFLASYFLQQHAISRRKTTSLLSDGARLGSPTGNRSRLASTWATFD